MLSVYLVNKALFRPATLLYMQISINITGMAWCLSRKNKCTHNKVLSFINQAALKPALKAVH